MSDKTTQEEIKMEKVGSTCGAGCPLCTKEGIIMLIVGFLLFLSENTYIKILGLGVIILAYIVPFIKILKNN